MLDTHRWHISPQVPQNWQVGIRGGYRGLSVVGWEENREAHSAGFNSHKRRKMLYRYFSCSAQHNTIPTRQKGRFFYASCCLKSSDFICTFLSSNKAFAPHFICKLWCASHLICPLSLSIIFKGLHPLSVLFQYEYNPFSMENKDATYEQPLWT